MEILQNCRQATEMILVCMRQRHNVQFVKSPGPQIRRDGLFAWIDAIVLFMSGKTSECATPINKSVLPPGDTTKSESPWPTSRTVTSSFSFVHFSPKG